MDHLPVCKLYLSYRNGLAVRTKVIRQFFYAIDFLYLFKQLILLNGTFILFIPYRNMEVKGFMNPFGFLFIIFGILSTWKPYIAWYLEIGWKLQDAEPSELALVWNRILGIIFTIIGIGMLIP